MNIAASEMGAVVNPFTLPYVDLDDKTDLPTKPGLYFVIDGKTLLYIGRSKDLNQRWKGHHRYKQIKAIAKNPQIAFLDVDDEELLWVERDIINRFNPPLNDTRVDAVQSIDDLRALIQEVHASNQGQERRRYKPPEKTASGEKSPTQSYLDQLAVAEKAEKELEDAKAQVLVDQALELLVDLPSHRLTVLQEGINTMIKTKRWQELRRIVVAASRLCGADERAIKATCEAFVSALSLGKLTVSPVPDKADPPIDATD